MQRVLDRIKEIEAVDDLDQLWCEIGEVFRQMEYPYFVYTLGSTDQDAFYYFDNFGLHTASIKKNSQRHQSKEAFYDPFLEYSCDNYQPTMTGVEFIAEHPYMKAKAVALIKKAAKLGMRSGVGIPLRLQGANRYGGFNLGSHLNKVDFLAALKEKLELSQLVCLLLHRQIEKVLDLKEVLLNEKAIGNNQLALLTDREQSVLKLLSEGYSRKRCADKLSVSILTVSTHTKNIYSKLNVHNKVEAINMIKRS